MNLLFSLLSCVQPVEKIDLATDLSDVEEEYEDVDISVEEPAPEAPVGKHRLECAVLTSRCRRLSSPCSDCFPAPIAHAIFRKRWTYAAPTSR